MAIEIPAPLLEAISNGRACLFLGSGASREASFPSTTDLAKYLVKKAGEPLSTKLSGQSLDSVAEYLYLEEGYGKPWVRQRIIEYFQEKHRTVKRPPSKAHETTTKISWNTIFTTNYDRLIEISYDSKSGCVQRVLPIYVADLQALRRVENVVRLVKLNGSVDEAERNSSHELVITFADQIKARSDNEVLYNLLREEAIKGPIIFIGFSFTHPGATQKGTSPEFFLLQEILREMGPAARWHYCVTPFDSSSLNNELIVKKLKTNRVQVINASFSEFMDSVFKQLSIFPTPLEKRPPITIPIAQARMTIDPDEYVNDKRHFEIIGSHLDELKPPSITESLNGYERWSSFFKGHFIERLCKKDFLLQIEQWSEKTPRIVSLVASPGWGKTFFLRDIAVTLYRKEVPVLWLNPYSSIEAKSEKIGSIVISTWDMRRIDRIISTINKIVEESANNKTIPLIIADNCPERIEDILNLYRYLISNNRRFILLISIRDYEFDSIVEEFPNIKTYDIFQPERLYEAKEEVRILIDFCTKHKVASIIDPGQKEVVAQRIIESEAYSAIILALQIIFDKQHRPFIEIIKGLWENIDNELARELLLKIASIHRFGSAFYPRLYTLLLSFPSSNHFQILEAYNYGLNRGILFETISEEEPCVSTIHSLVAEQIIKVSDRPPIEIDMELLSLIQNMTNRNLRDLHIVRNLLKQINDYKVSLSSEIIIDQVFDMATKSTNEDWVICQQFSKYLLNRMEYERALFWINRALEKNSNYSTLLHHKGNILRRWGMDLLLEGNEDESDNKFREARKLFTLSRIGSHPDEYGFVTHLDMLLFMIKKIDDDIQKANLIAEGVQLYRDAIRVVEESRYNFLLEPRFQFFDLNGSAVDELCERIENAVLDGRSSVYAAIFLANIIHNQGEYDRAIEILRKQRLISDEGILTWVKEASIHAREGNYHEAAKSIHSAKLRTRYAENAEALWNLIYLDVIISFILENYRDAREAVIRLIKSRFFSRRRFPRGYIWKESSRNIPSIKRTFKNHAKIWTGRINEIKPTGQFGTIRIENKVGNSFYIRFSPRYWSRRDLRFGDFVKFVVTILPNGLRADDPESKPFVNTVDDFYVMDINSKIEILEENIKRRIEAGEKISLEEMKLVYKNEEEHKIS